MSGIRFSLRWFVPVVLVLAVIARFRFAAVPVREFTVAPAEVVAEVLGTGTLDARVQTVISARIQERLAEVLVDQGDPVQADQLVARLDDGELARQVAVAEASLAATRATAERVGLDEERARAVEEQARLNHERITDLVATKVSSQADLDKAVELRRIAETDLRRARAATAEAQQAVATAEQNLAYHRERLGFTRLRSPYAGLITRRDRDPGGVVVPGASLLHLVATNELWVSAWVDETAAAQLQPGQPARVVFRSEPHRNFTGEVARLGRETDRETREFLVDVRVRELPLNWTIGQRAEVFIETGRKAQSLFVPPDLLQRRDGQTGVWVNDQGKAAWRPVAVGLTGRAAVEVTQGLAAGDRVVVAAGPGATLRPGQRIKAP